jgi:taurine dioxygenase
VLEVIAMTPVGAQLTGLRVDALDERTVTHLRHLLAEHGVLVLPAQQVDNDEFLRSCGVSGRRCSPSERPRCPDTPSSTSSATSAELSRRDRRFTTIRATYENPRFTRPYGPSRCRRVVGRRCSPTNTSRTKTLPGHVRQQLQGRTITHVLTGLQAGSDQQTSAVHPIFRVHPVSGRTFLYLSFPKRCAQVSGMSPQRAAETVAFLFDHSTRGDNVYRHAWAPGDVVLWDNSCVLYRADHAGVIGERVMHRGMVGDQSREQIGSGPG